MRGPAHAHQYIRLLAYPPPLFRPAPGRRVLTTRNRPVHSCTSAGHHPLGRRARGSADADAEEGDVVAVCLRRRRPEEPAAQLRPADPVDVHGVPGLPRRRRPVGAELRSRLMRAEGGRGLTYRGGRRCCTGPSRSHGGTVEGGKEGGVSEASRRPRGDPCGSLCLHTPCLPHESAPRSLPMASPEEGATAWSGRRLPH